MTTIADVLIREVVETGLCLSCGLCVAICEKGSLGIKGIAGKCQPEIIKGGCSDCGLCLNVCPGIEVDLFNLEKVLFKKNSYNLLGNYKKIGTGFSLNTNIRSQSASGGVVTTILKWLLKEKEVDKVIVLGFNKEKPYLTQYKIIDTPQKVILNAQSKYVVNHLGEVLNGIKGRIAIVTLPCQTHGLRKWQNLGCNYPKIKYILGLYCGNNLYFEATRILLRRLNIDRLSEIKNINYRAGKWPGYFQVNTLSGLSKRVSKDVFNYLSFFYTMPRCHLCPDLTNEFADISFGDAWNYEGRNKGGYTFILARTPKGENLLSRTIDEGKIFYTQISEEDALKMHSHHLRRKKIGVFFRLKMRKRKGLKIPDFHLYYKGKVKTSFLSALNPLSFVLKGIFSILPIFVIGIIMKIIRKTWKKWSYIGMSGIWDVETKND